MALGYTVVGRVLGSFRAEGLGVRGRLIRGWNCGPLVWAPKVAKNTYYVFMSYAFNEYWGRRIQKICGVLELDLHVT